MGFGGLNLHHIHLGRKMGLESGSWERGRQRCVLFWRSSKESLDKGERSAQGLCLCEREAVWL